MSTSSVSALNPKQKIPQGFEDTDFTDLNSIVKLFPIWAQSQYQIRANNVKGMTKSCNIEGFTLKTPYGDKVLLDNTDLVLEPNRRSVLFGENSTGKTLLFSNISSGLIKDFPKHIQVHHCKELETHELDESVIDTVLHSNEYLNTLFKVEAKITSLLSFSPSESSLDRSKLQSCLEYVKMCINNLKGNDAKDRIVKMLKVLGFDDQGMLKPCSALSGGLRMRVALCIAFFIEPDLLLLDEPTNHLDFPSVLWLENRLRAYKSSFLLVSHDRELLNNVCTSVLLIEDRKINYYVMSFKDFEKQKAKEDKKKSEDIDKFLAQNRNADPSTQLGRYVHDKKAWQNAYMQKQVALAGKFTFPVPVQLNPDDVPVIAMKDVRFSYDATKESPVFIFDQPISFTVEKNTRLAVLGPNGAGKSTWLKLMTKKLIPTQGTVDHHPDFLMAYFGQHSTAELDPEKTAKEFMIDSFPNESVGHLKMHLAKTGISNGIEDSRMRNLSYSQRSCVIFSKLTFKSPHLLIMDEPTNFLDLASVDSLISATNKYKGALLLVSHNREFLKKCANQYLAILPGSFKLYDDLKTAERSTYTFITEMEEGKRVDTSALSSALTKNAGNVANKPVVGTVTENKENQTPQVKVVAKVVVTPSATPSVKPSTVKDTYIKNEKCLCQWTDGKYYDAVIKNIVGDVYTVLYPEYGSTANVMLKSLRKKPAQTQTLKVVANKGK